MRENATKYALAITAYLLLIFICTIQELVLIASTIQGHFKSHGFLWPAVLGRFFATTLFCALSINVSVLLVSNIKNKWKEPYEGDSKSFIYNFSRTIAYSTLFYFGVGIFGERLAKISQLRLIDYGYVILVSAIFSAIVNVWFDLIVSLINRIRKN